MVNFREGWRDHLWQERFHSYPMDERHLLAAVRYVEMNPVDAGLVERAEDWEWSSARYHLGISTADRIVREQRLFGLVNDWRKYLLDANGHDNTNYELHLRTGRPLGAADFLDQLEQLIGTSLRRKRGGWQKRRKRKRSVLSPKFSPTQRWIVETYSAIALTLAAEVVAGSFCDEASFSKISPHTGIFDSPCAPIRVLPSIVAITLSKGKTPLFLFLSWVKFAGLTFKERLTVPSPFPSTPWHEAQ